MTRILFVEDEPTIAACVRDDLLLEGYVVDVATDGAAGATQGTAGSYDLILLDVMLPKKNGFIVCRELRAAGVRAPILMLTARGVEADKVLGLELGADDYITKPFGRLELHSRVKAALRRGAMSAGPAADIYESGPLKIDFGRCEVSMDGRLVEVTALELKLLRALLDAQGRVLTIDKLNAAAWGEDVFITNQVVYTHMNNLRRKIEKNPGSPRHLKTVRRVGYRFDQ